MKAAVGAALAEYRAATQAFARMPSATNWNRVMAAMLAYQTAYYDKE